MLSTVELHSELSILHHLPFKKGNLLGQNSSIHRRFTIFFFAKQMLQQLHSLILSEQTNLMKKNQNLNLQYISFSCAQILRVISNALILSFATKSALELLLRKFTNEARV